MSLVVLMATALSYSALQSPNPSSLCSWWWSEDVYRVGQIKRGQPYI